MSEAAETKGPEASQTSRDPIYFTWPDGETEAHNVTGEKTAATRAASRKMLINFMSYFNEMIGHVNLNF